MKKIILLSLLVIFIFLAGCAQPVTEQAASEQSMAEREVESPSERILVPIREPSPNQSLSDSPELTGAAQENIIMADSASATAASTSTCSRLFSPQFQAEPYYTGKLFDAHFHFPPAFEDEDEGWRMPVLGKEITLSDILCYFEKEQVKGSFMFYMWDAEDMEGSIQDAVEMKTKLPADVRLFLAPLEMAADELDPIVTKNPGVFDGFGEITFYDPERSGATPDDPVSLEIYQLAAREGLVVMFHPGANQRTKVENALQNNPSTTFLLHGYESEDYITELMDKYPNVYYSIDSATLYHFDGIFMSGPKFTFVSKFKKDFDTTLNNKVNKWKSRIEKHPDRFMWGTDRATDWHYNEEISTLFEEFARAFIGRLDPSVQERYAYKNAESLLN